VAEYLKLLFSSFWYFYLYIIYIGQYFTPHRFNTCLLDR